MNILDQIVASTKIRVENDKKAGLPYPRHGCDAPFLSSNQTLRTPFRFEQNLSRPSFSFICEVKKASPSKGIIAENFPYLDISREYENAGADAISVLTEPDYFQGSSDYLAEIRKAVKIPLLRKDFIIDPFQIEQSACLGADAILLICAILTASQLAAYIKKADGLGLSCLVEAHDREEIKTALKAGARIIGVNNRNLKTFEVDKNNSIRLRKLVPKDIPFVSESGIRTAQDVEILRQNGINAALIGEALMKAPNKSAVLSQLRGSYEQG